MQMQRISFEQKFPSFLILLNLVWAVRAQIYYDPHDYDAYGTRLASNNRFVILAQNDARRYSVAMVPFGLGYTCYYAYSTSSDISINVAVGRHQNMSQLFFIYLRTNSSSGDYQILGRFQFSTANVTMNGKTRQTCNRFLPSNQGERDVKVWKRSPSAMSTLQVDPVGKYAYGFLSNGIFIYDIERSSVQDLQWNDILSSVYFEPHALDIGFTDNQRPMALVAGYFQFDIEKALPIVYLIRLDPPYNMTVVDNFTIISSNQKFVRGRNAASYQFDFVMSVSIHDSTRQALLAVPHLKQTFLFSFNESQLIFKSVFNRSARSTAWLDDEGTQVGLLLNGVDTLPWAYSRVEVLNISNDQILYAYPNNQQTLTSWTNAPPEFIRLIKTHRYQSVVLANDGVLVLVPWTEAGYYSAMNEINEDRFMPKVCPPGTYKDLAGPTPCTVCPPNTKSSSVHSLSSLNATITDQTQSPTIQCTPCSTDGFCPLASVVDMNESVLVSLSQAYAYPKSPPSTSFDDILMENTFYLRSDPRRCLLISPFFWSLIVLSLSFVILIVMGILYYSSKGLTYFRLLTCIFRHSDLIGNGELWFGGLISFSMVVLIIYTFLFGSWFGVKYPLEASVDADFACDVSLRNAKFSSSLQLSSTIKTDDERIIFEMLDKQTFFMTVNFLQTGFTCDDLATEEMIGYYAVQFPYQTCVKHTDNATLTVSYELPYHHMAIQINLTGPNYIGGLLICLHGDRYENPMSSDVVQELNYCHPYYSANETIGRTTRISYALTKVINRTEHFDYSGFVNFSGIWIPTSIPASLNDRVVYQQRGQFHRYLFTQHLFILSFSETQFYVMNNQEPIARTGEIRFHNIIFTTTIIAIFALVFLLFKLTLMPIIQWLLNRLLLPLRVSRDTQEKTVEEKESELL